MREDVMEFATLMSEAMDRKQAERDKSGLPHYLSTEYPNKEAMERAEDKLEQLEFYVNSLNEDPDRPYPHPSNEEYIDRAIKTAVHLANFCMIISARCKRGLK